MIKNLTKVLAILGVLTATSGCIEVVETGHRGVETHYGKVVSESLPEGLYFYNPITSDIVTLDTKVQRLDGTEAMYTKDIQQAQLNFSMNYNLGKGVVHNVYQEVGTNWEERLIPHVIKGTLKSVIGQWDAVDLIANRGKATNQILIDLQTSLEKTGVNVTNFEINEITYTDIFEKAVEAKVTAIQEAVKSKNITVRIQEEAKQQVISAKAEAESMRIRANALSQNKALVEYEAVQKWNGVLPTMTMGGGAVPFINIK